MSRDLDKRSAFERALSRSCAFVHFDARAMGVLVPQNLRASEHAVLQFSHRFPLPMREFVVSDDGVGAVLSFGRRPFNVFIPWRAVFSIVDGDALPAVWLDDAPNSVIGDIPDDVRELIDGLVVGIEKPTN
jgi:hypothetical protein